MIAAIMQPYFFPYIGYFQLMQAVDVFVFHDDAQYIKGGWVNRNRIRVGDGMDWLTLPVRKASNYLPINERDYALESDAVEKIKRRLAASYEKAPAYLVTAPIIFDLLGYSDPNVAAFNGNLLVSIARRLGIDCAFVKSSELDKAPGLKGEAKVIDLCRRIGASHYINPIGGTTLYDRTHFADAGLELSFITTAAPPAMLEAGPHHLSVIDGLLREGVEGYRRVLTDYVLDGGKYSRDPK